MEQAPRAQHGLAPDAAARATANQEAIALVTTAMHGHIEELADLMHEFDPDGRHDLLGALVSMSRSLCYTTARIAWAIDANLTNRETLALSDELVPATAEEVLGSYARSVAAS